MSPVKKSQDSMESPEMEESTPMAEPRNDYQDRGARGDQATEVVKGILDIKPEGHGFLRPKLRDLVDLQKTMSVIMAFLR
jgi:transcription termination factor Rho